MSSTFPFDAGGEHGEIVLVACVGWSSSRTPPSLVCFTFVGIRVRGPVIVDADEAGLLQRGHAGNRMGVYMV